MSIKEKIKSSFTTVAPFILALALVGGFVAANPNVQFTPFDQDMNAAPAQPSQQVGWKGTVTAKQYNADGELIYTHHGENILTNEGANFIRSSLIGETSTAINWIGLSNKDGYSTNVNHGYLDGEITNYNLSRKKGTITKTGTGTWEIEVTWIANGSIEGVQATGLFPHDVQSNVTSDANILIAEETMSPKAFRKGYEFTLTWEIQQVAG